MKKKVSFFTKCVVIVIGMHIIQILERQERVKRKCKEGTLTIWDLL